MEARTEVVDTLATVLFAAVGVYYALWGLWWMVTLVLLPRGLLYLAVGLLLLYVARGLRAREREAWWIGFLLLVLFLIGIVVPAVGQVTSLFPLHGPPDLRNLELLSLGAGALALILFLLVRRRAFGIGRRVPPPATVLED